MSNNDKCIKPKSNGDARFIELIGKHRGDPSRFSGVEQQKEYIMLLNKFLKCVEIFKSLFDVLLLENIVPRHRNAHLDASRFDLWVDFYQLLGSRLGLWLTTFNSVLELVESLSHWVRVTDIRIVNACNIFNAPSDQISSKLTPKCSRTKEQAFLGLYLLNVKAGHESPFHQLDVEIYCFPSQCTIIHEGLQVQ
jgi:hypothetical protein